jgi:hypothetical protein
MLTQDFTAPATWGGRTGQFTSAVPADFEAGFVIILVKPGTTVVFLLVMVKAENMSAPLARVRDLLKDFSAIMTPADHV